MPQKPTTDVRSAASQRDNRWKATVFDQHRSPRFPNGRPWWGQLEHPADKVNDPAFCTTLLPGDVDDPFGSTWSAPWLPEQTMRADGRGTYRFDYRNRRITWTYGAIIEDHRAATRDYYTAAAKIAHANGWPAPGLNEPVSFQIHAILLDPPMSPKIAEAALAGDPWLLGHTSQVNEELDALLKGIRVRNDVRPLVTPAQVLSTDPAIQALVAAEVAKALAAMPRRSHKKGGRPSSSPAVPSAA
jgi:hypothetical protein